MKVIDFKFNGNLFDYCGRLGDFMDNTEFYELFYFNLEKVIKNESYINSIKELMNSDKFTKKAYENLLEEVFDE